MNSNRAKKMHDAVEYGVRPGSIKESNKLKKKKSVVSVDSLIHQGI
jgi:hypothetical protein